MASTTIKEGTRIRAWNYEFDWTSEHLTAEEMRPLMFSYDELATEALDCLEELVPSVSLRSSNKPSNSPESAPNNPCPHPDLYALLQQHAPSDPTLQRLWTEVNTVPSWVNWDEISRGQQVFLRYSGPSIVSLTFHALLGGMGSRRIVETLSRTGGFSVRVARRRLLETFTHVLDVTESLTSIQPGGRGFASTLRVRLLHASVRRRILRLAAQNPSYFDTSALGIPISDLDSLGTILTFSADLLFVGFPRQGIFPSSEEISSYLALWRYVAYLIGCPTERLSTSSLAKATMESLILSEIAPSETSCVLANNIIAALANTPPTYASADFLRAEAYWLNGRELATQLQVPKPPVVYTLLVAGQCLFFMTTNSLRRIIPAWDEKHIENMRKGLRTITLKQLGGEEAMHGFQYVPEMGKVTTGEREKGKGRRGKGMLQRWVTGGSEERGLVAVLAAAVVASFCVWNFVAAASWAASFQRSRR